MSNHEQMIGVVAGTRIAAALVEGNSVASAVRFYPPPSEQDEDGDSSEIHAMPMEAMADQIARVIHEICQTEAASPRGVGIGFPGIIRAGVIEESPNLKQAKGSHFSELIRSALGAYQLDVPVSIFNDADVTAAGMAAARGQLEKLIRVWTLGHGVGFGRYPHSQGVWEGGHMVVTLDPKEAFCGCGGRGHLEGIMGHRAMRLRFLDLEPDEIFENARERDQRCMDFELLWHRALAAASANSIHMSGPGKFFITGPSARFVKTGLLAQYLHEMVTMTALQGSVFEVVPTTDEIAIIGAAVNAGRSA